MVTTTSLKVGESLTIGLYFNNNYQLPTTCNLIVFIGGVCVGNLFAQEPEIEKVGIYYTIRLSSQDTSKMRGYRDLIVVLDDPDGFGNKKFIVGGILFDRMADEFITTSENQGYNMLIGMTVDESMVSGNVELIEAIKGEKGIKGDKGDQGEQGVQGIQGIQGVQGIKGDKGERGIQGEKGEDAVLPDGMVIDEGYVHTDNNYTNADKTLLSTALQSELDPVYALDKDRLSNTSGVNTGDQDLSGLVEKINDHSLVPDTEINKLAGYPELENLGFSHADLTDKNSEAAFQHVDTTVTKETLDEADKVPIYDSVTGEVVLTPKSNLQTDLTTVNQAITNLQNNKANKIQEAWITPTLLNGWVNAVGNEIQFYKDNFGIVRMRGTASGGTFATTVFTLPVGYRPIRHYGANTTAGIGSIGYITILSSGIVWFRRGTENAVDNITFKAEQ